MNVFYESLPLTVYLIITILIPSIIFVALIRIKKFRKSIPASLGMFSICTLGYISAYIRIADVYQLNITPWMYNALYGNIVIMSILLSVGSYGLSKDNPKQKRAVILASTTLVLIFLFFIVLIIFKM